MSDVSEIPYNGQKKKISLHNRLLPTWPNEIDLVYSLGIVMPWIRSQEHPPLVSEKKNVYIEVRCDISN